MAVPEKLKIAILDDYQNASGPYFSKFIAAGHEVVTFSDTLLPYPHRDTPQSAKDALEARLEPFHVISTTRERTPLPAELIRKLPHLRLILTNGHRNAAIDMDACRERGIVVVTAQHLPLRNSRAVDTTTEHVVALILSLARNIVQDDASVKSGGWQTSFTTALSGKTFGVVGLGRLGARVARVLHMALGMRVLAWSQNLTQEKADEAARNAGLPADEDGEKTFKVVTREELFSTADVVSLHVVLSERTRGLITREDLETMKPSALFVNTSREPVVRGTDLLQVLKQGRIRGAALDVFDVEPLPADSEWRRGDWGKNGTSHVVVTPHTGYVNEELITAWYETQALRLDDWIAGRELIDRLA